MQGMEHRCGTRQKVGLTVLVRRRGWAGSVVAELTDLSITGAFLAGPPDAFPLRSLVRIEAAPPGGASRALLTCRAMVARIGTGGVGVVFDQVRPRGFAPLFSPGGTYADRAAFWTAPDPATSGTVSSTQLPDSRRAGLGIA